jgi:hypothetical protein
MTTKNAVSNHARRLATAWAAKLLPLLLLRILPAVVQAQSYTNNYGVWFYTTNNDTVTITGYTGPGGAVTIPESIPDTINGLPVTSIGPWAFQFCTSLNSVTIPNSVTSIGEFAFSHCTSLASVTIGNSVTNIGDVVFDDCSRLSAITVDPLNPMYSSVDGVLFNLAQTTLIEYPGGITGAYTIPGSVTSIGGSAFQQCQDLTSVTIPNTVTNIGDDAFIGSTSLTSVTIPNRVTNIGINAFSDCISLTAITVDTNNPSYGSVDGVLFNLAQTTLIEYPGGITGAYTIPSSVTCIRESAFTYCTSLTSVTIGSSVTNIGDYAFAGCTSLASVTIPNSVTSIGESTFADCTSLTGVTIPNTVTNIGEDAFAYCTSLTNVTIPNSVTNIGEYAFLQCLSLKGVYFEGNAPSPITDLSVFSGDKNPTVYYLPGTTGWGSTFDGCPTVLWNPQVQTSRATFGMKSNQFSFNITGTEHFTVVVEASSSLVSPTWSPLQTITLTNGSAYFTDPQWTNYPTRFYRLNMP